MQPTTHLSTPNAMVPKSARECDEAVTGRKWALRDQKRASGGPLHFVFGLFTVCYDALCPTYGPVEEYGRSIQGRNVTTFEATEAAASVVFTVVASAKST